jgi:hypothetical protein
VLKLTAEATGGLGLRYFNMVETLPDERSKTSTLDGVRSLARGGEIPHFRQFSVTPGERQATLIGDYSFVKANMFVRRFPQGYVAVGGENLHLPYDSRQRERYHRDFCPNDPLAWTERHIYCASGTWLMPVVKSFDDVLNGAWMTAEDERHTWELGSMILGPKPAGCVDARANPVCSLDGKLTMAFLNGKWLIFGRSNVKYNGGRFVQVAEYIYIFIYVFICICICI